MNRSALIWCVCVERTKTPFDEVSVRVWFREGIRSTEYLCMVTWDPGSWAQSSDLALF